MLLLSAENCYREMFSNILIIFGIKYTILFIFGIKIHNLFIFGIKYTINFIYFWY